MSQLELSPQAQLWVNVVLIWIGFGTLAGLLARVIVPFRRPAGLVSTLLLGALGSAVGLLVLSGLLGGPEFNPISPFGFLAAAAGAFFLLLGYRASVYFLERRLGKKH